MGFVCLCFRMNAVHLLESTLQHRDYLSARDTYSTFELSITTTLLHLNLQGRLRLRCNQNMHFQVCRQNKGSVGSALDGWSLFSSSGWPQVGEVLTKYQFYMQGTCAPAFSRAMHTVVAMLGVPRPTVTFDQTRPWNCGLVRY